MVGCCVGLLSESLAAPVVILKLDDLRDNAGSRSGFPRVLDIVTRHDAVATFGLIGDSLQGFGKSGYYDFLKALQASGRVELWNHGWTHKREADGSTTEFNNRSLSDQEATLRQVNARMLEATGIRLRSFGAPYNSNDHETEAALRAAGLDVWFYPAKGTALSGVAGGITALINRVDMEPRTGVVDEAYFTQNLASASAMDYIVLQGHPPMWDEGSFAAFERIVATLKAKGCVFMTAAGYADSRLR
jgi:peptidoglycan/xylan/chitin deacetylase (PgdA/CDA1 family)